MKLLISLLAVAGLSGCVAYGVPYGSAYYDTGSYYSGGYYAAPYVIDQRPVYIHGHGRRGDHHRGHYRDGRGSRDRDGDGIVNRYDRDRDGDGVPNRRDSRPNNPRN